MIDKSNDRNACTCDAPTRVEQSHNYDSNGRHVGPFEAGIYWVPANEMSCVVDRMQHHREILNNYRFTPRSPRSC